MGGGAGWGRGEYNFLPVPVPVRLLNLTKILFTVLVNVITLDGTYGIYQNSYFWDPTSSSSSTSSSLSIIYVIIISLLCSSPMTSSSPAFIIWLSAMSAMLRAPLKRGKILQYNRQDLENAELLQLIATGDLFTETVDESAVGTIEKFNVSASAVGTIDQSNISEAVNDVFLPPKIENRSNKSKVLILTSEDILEQKGQLEIRKNDKQANKAKRVKKVKV